MTTLLFALALLAAPVARSVAAPSAPVPVLREEALRHYLAGRWLERTGDRAGALAEYSRALTESPDDAGVLLRLAELATHDGQPMRTIEYADRVLARDTTSAKAHWLRGAALFQLQRREESLAALERSVAHAPDDAEMLRTLVRVAESLERHDRAAAGYVTLSRIDPDDAEAWFQRATSEARAGEFRLADSLLARSLAIDPIRPGAIFLRAWIHENLGQLDDAIADYREHLRVHGSDDATRRRMVVLLARAGRTEEALALAREVVRDAPRDPEALHVLADLAFTRGASREGEDALRRMRETAPTDARWVARSLQILARHARRREGLALARTWVATRGSDPDALMLAARAHVSLGDAPGAVRLAQQAVTVSPDSLPPRRLLARVLEDAGRVSEAERELRALRAGRPQDASLAIDLGALLERRGDVDGAVAAGRDALALEPRSPEANNFLGYLLADRGRDLEEAHALIRAAVAADPDNGAYLDSLGWVLFRLGRLEEAQRLLERALQLTGGDPVIHEHLGDVFAALRQAERAREQYQLSLAGDSRNARVRDKLRERP